MYNSYSGRMPYCELRYRAQGTTKCPTVRCSANSSERLFGCKVDLVVSDAIKPRLRSIILSEAVHAPEL